ncbi:hypothetical protein GCM10020001_005750 [Nonomuraea salmonea]
MKALLTGVDDGGRLIEVAGPKALRAGLRKLRRLGRTLSRKVKGSNNRRKAADRLARHHARVANVRADALHKATTALAAQYATVVVEDLNVNGMLANRRLARAVADQGFGTARRLLAYKTGWNGGRSWWPTAGTPAPRRARRADGESQASRSPSGPLRASLAAWSSTGTSTPP